jgi:phage terminase large subunit GpA-like protein
MGEPWEERALELTDERLLSHVGTHERGTIPQFVQLLTAGVDVHGYGHTFNVIIRGWGWAEESALILSAEVENWQGIEQLICHAEYPRASREGVSLRVGLCAIDSGYRTHEVYDFCRTWAHVCRATKGQSGSHMTGPMKPSIIDYHPVRGRALRNALTLWHLNVDYYKDKLHALLNVSHGDPGYFWLCFGVDDTYAKQLTSETKVIRYDRRGRPSQVWEAAYRGAANHFLDAEIYALAAADMAGALTLPRLAPEEGTPSGREALHREPFVGGGRDWWHQHR